MSRIPVLTAMTLLLAMAAARGVFGQAAPLPDDSSVKSVAAQDTATVDSQDNGIGQDLAGFGNAAQHQRPEDLTLGNFFSAGWDDDWAKKERDTGTPNLALLRVQTNFMEREFRMNYYQENAIAGTAYKSLSDCDGLIAWGFSRRLMLEITGAYQWQDPHTGLGVNGGTPGLVSRFQLVDTESSSYAFNFKAVAPNDPLGTDQSTLSYGLAGFEDLAYWFGLQRVGLYYSFLFDDLAGPLGVGAKRADVQYDVTLAKTITDPDTPLLGNLTLVVENFAQTDLDGPHQGRTLVTVTPEVRFNLGKAPNIKLGKDNWILFGTDIPVSDYHPWGVIYRLSYIKNF